MSVKYYQISYAVTVATTIFKKHPWNIIVTHWQHCGGRTDRGVFYTIDDNTLPEFYLTFPYDDSLAVSFTEITIKQMDLNYGW